VLNTILVLIKRKTKPKTQLLNLLKIEIWVNFKFPPPSNRCVFEIKPLNFQFGNEKFVAVYAMFGVDIKIN
jgi:hypothetical protein